MPKSQENATYCQNLVRSDDPDRYLLSLFAPHVAQRSLWALYGFNQEVAKIRETVSESMLGEIRIQWWQDVLAEIEQGEVRQQPVIEELALLLEVHPIKLLLTEILEARKSGLLGEEATSFKALAEYAKGVGGKLNLAAAHIVCGNLSNAGQVATEQLGTAWAMLGLVRAIPHSWQTNATPLTNDMALGLQSPDASKAYTLLRPTITKMLEYVENQRALALSQQAEMPKAEQSLLLIAKQIKLYQVALSKVENNPFELFKVEPTQLKKISTLFWAKLTDNF